MSRLPALFQRRPDWAALVIALALVAIGGVMLWDAARLAGVSGGYSGVGPASAPRLVGIGLIVLAVWTVFEAIGGKFPSRPAQAPQPVAWIVGGLAFQLLTLTFLGFSIATGVMFACTARAFGRRNLAVSIPVGIVLAFLAWLVFARLLMLSLPAGPLERLFFPGVK
jgi:putative tricarboxylic transport membrane protein